MAASPPTSLAQRELGKESQAMQTEKLRKLPGEIWSRIFSFLPVYDLGQVGAVCKDWRLVSREPSLWKQRVLKGWHLKPEQIEAITDMGRWRQCYRELERSVRQGVTIVYAQNPREDDFPKHCSYNLQAELEDYGFRVNCVDVDNYNYHRLSHESIFIFIGYTARRGLPPESAVEFCKYLMYGEHPKDFLKAVSFCTFGIGDLAQGTYHNQLARSVDFHMSQLGAIRLLPVGFADMGDSIGVEFGFNQWRSRILAKVRRHLPAFRHESVADVDNPLVVHTEPYPPLTRTLLPDHRQRTSKFKYAAWLPTPPPASGDGVIAGARNWLDDFDIWGEIYNLLFVPKTITIPTPRIPTVVLLVLLLIMWTMASPGTSAVVGVMKIAAAVISGAALVALAVVVVCCAVWVMFGVNVINVVWDWWEANSLSGYGGGGQGAAAGGGGYWQIAPRLDDNFRAL